ncbi:hypothetical protein PtA15_2A332 [Puccinia triticina]|uniref:Uncharacterized protein n=1 Tax=Puccinia triticina TaxID=208348 RepID=A0ABY7CA49_9BASI|nr:uncharacterized protein PtA15_2A332 [Puccinia triticina]WAQ82019.1 hypothetical protein PtA15_2A332 [Puccinia triticina]
MAKTVPQAAISISATGDIGVDISPPSSAPPPPRLPLPGMAQSRASASPRPSRPPSRQSNRIITPVKAHGNYIRPDNDSRQSLAKRTRDDTSESDNDENDKDEEAPATQSKTPSQSRRPPKKSAPSHSSSQVNDQDLAELPNELPDNFSYESAGGSDTEDDGSANLEVVNLAAEEEQAKKRRPAKATTENAGKGKYK